LNLIYGDKSKMTLLVEKFKKLIENNFKLNVILIDERNTTNHANRIMLEANLSRKKRKSKKDMIAAQLILDEYLRKYNGKR